MSGNWVKAVVLGGLVLLAGSLAGDRAMAMGEEPASGGQTVNQYLNPALRQQQLLLASARAIELQPEPPRYHLFDGVLPRLASPLVVEFWADPQCRAAGEFEVVIGADRLRWSCKTFT